MIKHILDRKLATVQTVYITLVVVVLIYTRMVVGAKKPARKPIKVDTASAPCYPGLWIPPEKKPGSDLEEKLDSDPTLEKIDLIKFILIDQIFNILCNNLKNLIFV